MYTWHRDALNLLRLSYYFMILSYEVIVDTVLVLMATLHFTSYAYHIFTGILRSIATALEFVQPTIIIQEQRLNK